MRKEIVIIGGAAAGMTAATQVRRNCPECSISVIERGEYISYAVCGLPYFISGDVDTYQKLILNTPEDIYNKYKIDVRIRHEAVQIYPRERRLVIRNIQTGSTEDQGYDRLIIATGATPIAPDIPGIHLPGVYSIRSINDAIALKQQITNGFLRKAIIVGASFLGMEMAEALRRNNVDVLLIESKPHIMDPFELEITSLVKDELLHNGCQLQKSVTIKKVTGTSERVQAVRLSNGAEVSTDAVILATGVKPNTFLAKSANIATGVSGAIRINQKCGTNIPGIYAIGDCVEVKHCVSGKYIYAPMATTALKHARVAANNACGKFTRFGDVAGTAIVKIFTLEVAKTGLDKSHFDKYATSAEMVTIHAASRVAYFPGAEDITMKIIFDKRNGQLLGAQLAGREGVSGRIDVFATAIYNKMRVHDLINLDLCYTPPFKPSWEPIITAARQAMKKLPGSIS